MAFSPNTGFQDRRAERAGATENLILQKKTSRASRANGMLEICSNIPLRSKNEAVKLLIYK
jgi:hypothetical protein